MNRLNCVLGPQLQTLDLSELGHGDFCLSSSILWKRKVFYEWLGFAVRLSHSSLLSELFP